MTLVMERQTNPPNRMWGLWDRKNSTPTDSSLIVPPEVDPICWYEMSDDQRREIVESVARDWYHSVGKHWTEEQWVQYLARRINETETCNTSD